jgi:hypothetical protein
MPKAAGDSSSWTPGMRAALWRAAASRVPSRSSGPQRSSRKFQSHRSASTAAANRSCNFVPKTATLCSALSAVFKGKSNNRPGCFKHKLLQSRKTAFDLQFIDEKRFEEYGEVNSPFGLSVTKSKLYNSTRARLTETLCFGQTVPANQAPSKH